ncbi:hypothetical protein [Caenimonas sp. SL110]|uniref:hypothetical protein n=1 Tax=Caenimonas sp. SL110 TaxID=1450524 RepID=UPI0013792295|nr:hypothetical protein [Caenimonas sp. SL110]
MKHAELGVLAKRSVRRRLEPGVVEIEFNGIPQAEFGVRLEPGHAICGGVRDADNKLTGAQASELLTRTVGHPHAQLARINFADFQDKRWPGLWARLKTG